MKFDFAQIKKAYIVGIKGSGIVAIAEILKSMGVEVSGSDTDEKFFTDKVLQKLNIKYFEKFSIENIPPDADVIVFSTAYREDNNIEIAEAKKRKLPMMSYPEMLGEIFNQKYGIAVCGTHGKTTTSAMLADVLKKIGADPGAVIGSRVTEWGSNALSGKGELFVIEADEFQNKLKLYEPKAAILTNVDWDHPDFFPSFAEYKKAFADFAEKIPKTGFLVVWGDSAATNEVVRNAKCEIIKYGFQKDNDIRIMNYELRVMHNLPVQIFDILFGDKKLGRFEIQLIGKHNALNAAAVIAVCHKLNIDLEKIREALASFKGTSRRFEYVGKKNGAILIDDYGHHPEEIKATIKGAREIYPNKNIIAVFHPHSYSRTEVFLHDFSQSFDDADKVIVLDIYASARENSGKINSKNIVDLINKYDRGKAEYIPDVDAVVESLKDKIGDNDMVLCIGAGNVFEIAEKLKKI